MNSQTGMETDFTDSECTFELEKEYERLKKGDLQHMRQNLFLNPNEANDNAKKERKPVFRPSMFVVVEPLCSSTPMPSKKRLSISLLSPIDKNRSLRSNCKKNTTIDVVSISSTSEFQQTNDSVKQIESEVDHFDNNKQIKLESTIGMITRSKVLSPGHVPGRTRSSKSFEGKSITNLMLKTPNKSKSIYNGSKTMNSLSTITTNNTRHSELALQDDKANKLSLGKKNKQKKSKKKSKIPLIQYIETSEKDVNCSTNTNNDFVVSKGRALIERNVCKKVNTSMQTSLGLSEIKLNALTQTSKYSAETVNTSMQTISCPLEIKVNVSTQTIPCLEEIKENTLLQTCSAAKVNTSMQTSPFCKRVENKSTSTSVLHLHNLSVPRKRKKKKLSYSKFEKKHILQNMTRSLFLFEDTDKLPDEDIAEKAEKQQTDKGIIEKLRNPWRCSTESESRSRFQCLTPVYDFDQTRAKKIKKARKTFTKNKNLKSLLRQSSFNKSRAQNLQNKNSETKNTNKSLSNTDDDSFGSLFEKIVTKKYVPPVISSDDPQMTHKTKDVITQERKSYNDSKTNLSNHQLLLEPPEEYKNSRDDYVPHLVDTDSGFNSEQITASSRSKRAANDDDHSQLLSNSATIMKPSKVLNRTMNLLKVRKTLPDKAVSTANDCNHIKIISNVIVNKKIINSENDNSLIQELIPNSSMDYSLDPNSQLPSNSKVASSKREELAWFSNVPRSKPRNVSGVRRRSNLNKSLLICSMESDLDMGNVRRSKRFRKQVEREHTLFCFLEKIPMSIRKSYVKCENLNPNSKQWIDSIVEMNASRSQNKLTAKLKTRSTLMPVSEQEESDGEKSKKSGYDLQLKGGVNKKIKDSGHFNSSKSQFSKEDGSEALVSSVKLLVENKDKQTEMIISPEEFVTKKTTKIFNLHFTVVSGRCELIHKKNTMYYSSGQLFSILNGGLITIKNVSKKNDLVLTFLRERVKA